MARSNIAREIRIVVIGKPSLMRDGVGALLRAHEGMDVLGVIEDPAEPIESAASSSNPDIAIMSFPVVTRGNLDAISAVRKRWSAVHVVVVLASRLDDSVLNAAKHAEIDGCLLASDDRTALISAVRSVSMGKRYFTPAIAGEASSGAHRLTNREQEVMRLIAAGYRTREIADQLSLSRKTVEKHRGSLMRKLGLRSATAVAAYAITHGYWIP